MTWQFLEGASQIPITLFEATAELDAGPIYLQHTIDLQGTDLVEEWCALQAEATISLCLEWLDRYTEALAHAQHQQGEARHYRRRPSDSKLDPERSHAEQFNLLRVVDIQLYPAILNMRGSSYYVYTKTQRYKKQELTNCHPFASTNLTTLVRHNELQALKALTNHSMQRSITRSAS